MDTTPLWTLLPLAAALFLALILLGRSSTWSDPVSIRTEQPTKEYQQEVDTTEKHFTSRALVFLTTHYLKILLTGLFLSLLLFLSFTASAQLTGEITLEADQSIRPFYFLHSLREFLRDNYAQISSASNLLCGLLALAFTTTAAIRQSSTRLNFSLLWIFISLAGSAQWMISGKSQISTGIALYLCATIGFFVWSKGAQQTISMDLSKKRSIPLRLEVILVILVLALATFGRIYSLKSIPYGIEGDEAKWTAEIVAVGIRNEPDKLGIYHRDALPVSFFMQTIFHKILGPSIIAARFEVAFFSILATFIFYLLLRQVTIAPLSLLAAWLLSASIFDISVSRMAHVENHVKIWVILTLALLAWAVKTKRWYVYAGSGIALAISLLTYDTAWPLVLVAFLITTLEARQQKDQTANTLRNLIALLTPSILISPQLIPYIADRMDYYNFSGRQADLSALWMYFTSVVSSWYVEIFHDFSYNRTGALLNAFLLPWMTFGLAAVLATPRRRLSFWTLIWALLFIIPIPVAAYSPFGRIYYPALPAVYTLAAIGMYLFGRSSLRALGNEFRPLLITISLLVLIWIPLSNLYIYFNEVYDYESDKIRREIAELAGNAASPDALIILASIPNTDEPLNYESQMIELFMLRNIPKELIKDSYKYVALNDVLPSLPNLSGRPNLSILLDKSIPAGRPQRNDLSEALRKCYPQALWVEGIFVDRVDINAEALASPTCISARLSLESNSANTIHWQLEKGTASKITLKCEDQQNIHRLIQAETLPLTPGWNIETAVAPNWAGTGFLMDNFGSHPITFEFDLQEGNPLYLWVRYYKRIIDNSPAQFTINGQTLFFGQIPNEKINQWSWERVGPFNIPAGTHVITLDRPYNDNPQEFMAIFVDELTITTDVNFLPSNDLNQYLVTETTSFSQEQTQGYLVPEFEPGSYICSLEAFSKKSLVDAFGHSPLKSNFINFVIAP